MATTKFDLVTPLRTLYSGEAEMIVCRTVDGEIAFLANHTAYIGALEAGLVRIIGTVAEGDQAGSEVRLAVRGGFVEVKDNEVIMLADDAVEASDVDVAQARQDETEATQQVSAAGDDEHALAGAEHSLRWAQARLELADAQS